MPVCGLATPCAFVMGLRLVDAAADPLEASIDREEHVAAVRRFRVATRIGMLAWIAYCSLVWLIDRWVGP